jgi:zinc protease
MFADWPFQGQKPTAIPTNTTFAPEGAYLVDKDVNQGRVSMMLPGILRDSPDYFTVMMMNDILGGGGFISRLVNRVRSDEGLAYSVHSSFPGGVYFPLTFTAAFQSKSRTVPFATSIVLEEMQNMAKSPVTDLEFNTSKRGLIDRFPRTFATKGQTANALAGDEFTGRYFKDPEFWKKYRSRLEAVTKDDLQRVAAKYLNPQKIVILVVGQKDEILKGHPDHPVKLVDLAGGHLTSLPLRDPMTMKPTNTPNERAAAR